MSRECRWTALFSSDDGLSNISICVESADYEVAVAIAWRQLFKLNPVRPSEFHLAAVWRYGYARMVGAHDESR